MHEYIHFVHFQRLQRTNQELENSDFWSSTSLAPPNAF